MTNDFAHTVHKYWVPFLTAVYDSFHKWGFAVWSVENVREPLPSDPTTRRRLQIPHCLPHGTFRVEVRHNGRHARVTYHVYRQTSTHLSAADAKPDRSLRVLVSALHPPSSTGMVQSPLLSLIHDYEWLTCMREYALRIEHARAHPPLITEQKAAAVHQNDAGPIEMFADFRATGADEEAETYRRNKKATSAFHRQVNLTNRLNGKHLADARMAVDPFTGRLYRRPNFKQQWQENVFTLPEGQTLAHPANPPERRDLIEAERIRADQVCAMMGVPRSLLMSTGVANRGSSTSSSSSGLSYQAFMRSLETVARELALNLKWVYAVIYEGNDVDITFPYLPVVEMEALAQLGELGLVSRKTLATRMLASLGLPLSDLALQGEAATKTMTLPEHQQKDPAPK
jgi:hypothetical protein